MLFTIINNEEKTGVISTGHPRHGQWACVNFVSSSLQLVYFSAAHASICSHLPSSISITVSRVNILCRVNDYFRHVKKIIKENKKIKMTYFFKIPSKLLTFIKEHRRGPEHKNVVVPGSIQQ